MIIKKFFFPTILLVNHFDHLVLEYFLKNCRFFLLSWLDVLEINLKIFNKIYDSHFIEIILLLNLAKSLRLKRKITKKPRKV